MGEVVKEVTRNDPTSEAPIMMITANNGFIEQSERYAFDNAGESLKKYILLQKGELAYNHGASKLRPFGSCFALTTAESARIPFVYHCFSAENKNAEFLSIELNGSEVESQLRKIVSSGARMDGLLNISFDEYSTVTVLLPDIKEQEHIADFFRNLDHLITLHQRKYDKLQVLKKAMLEKMFPKNGSSVPEIRFKGFTDAWEQRKLGEVVKEVTRNDPTSEAPIMMITANNGFIEQSERYAFDNAGESLKKYILLQKGELAYNHGASKLRPFGSCFALTTAESARIPFVYHCFSAENKNAEFLSIELNGSEVESQLRKIVSSGARMDGLLNISFDEYSTVTVLLPDIKEQEHIADFFRNLDHLITLHQRKYDKLQVLKKAMLEKMFPKNGSSVPEIRFKGFTDAWEQRKLGEILQERNTRTSDFESNPLYSLTIESGVTPKTDRYERSSLVTKTEDLFKTVKPNEFVTNPMNLRFGALGYNKNAFTVSVSGYYDVFSIDDDKCSGFWNAYFKTPTAMNIFDNAATGSLIEKRRVKYSTLQQLAFYMPNDLSEKAEIGKYMDTFDHLITLHQRELEKLQNIKKSMLEKMFV